MEVFRRRNETMGGLLRRFSRKIQQSGVIIRARKLRYYESKLSLRAQKERALRRIKMREDSLRMEKLGKNLDE